MEDKILVITSSILDQGALPENRRAGHGPLSVVSDLIDLGVNLVPVPNISKHFDLYRKDITKEEYTEEAYQKYIKSHLVPLVNEVMERVRNGATFLGILSYAQMKPSGSNPKAVPS